MKLRRSLTLAAATVAMAPAVLLAAPGAYATDGASPASTATVTTAAQDDSSSTEGNPTPPTGDTNPPDNTNDSTGPGEPGSAGDSDEKAGGEQGGSTGDASPQGDENAGTGADGSTGEGHGGSSGEDNAGKDGENAAPDPSKPGSDGREDQEEPTGNWCGPYQTNDKLYTYPGDRPMEVVAGSGFHPFAYHVINHSDQNIKNLKLFINVRTKVDFGSYGAEYKYVTFQYMDPATGKWSGIELDQWGGGTFTTVDVAAHESLSIDMRLSVADDAPTGTGLMNSFGRYDNENGGYCYTNETDIDTEFTIWAAGTDTGNPPGTEPEPEPGTGSGTEPEPGTEPQGGRNDNPLTPTAAVPAGNGMTPNGHLAETGAGSALPAIVLAGGLAVCAGVGTVYAVRRRRATDAGATA